LLIPEASIILRIIETRTAALTSMVRSAKSLTQVSGPVKRQFRIDELFERIEGLYMARLRQGNVSFRQRINPSSLELNADLELIETAIINLIQNALEAMSETKVPELELSAIQTDPGQIILSVSDNGEGIKEEARDRLFLPFFSTKPGNSGIGLSLSQQIMTVHNGRIEIHSTGNSGTVFNLVF
jgi:C4-dicarboxylate-specific signal transduction histidine kinase